MQWLTIDSSKDDQSKKATTDNFYLIVAGNDMQLHVYKVRFSTKQQECGSLTITSISFKSKTKVLFPKGINKFNSIVQSFQICHKQKILVASSEYGQIKLYSYKNLIKMESASHVSLSEA